MLLLLHAQKTFRRQVISSTTKCFNNKTLNAAGFAMYTKMNFLNPQFWNKYYSSAAVTLNSFAFHYNANIAVFLEKSVGGSVALMHQRQS